MTDLSSVQYLMWQDIAVRGHKKEEGNLYHLLKCQSDDIPGLSNWLSDGHTSHMTEQMS